MKQMAYYQQAIEKAELQEKQSKGRLRRLSIARLATVVIFGLGVYLLWATYLAGVSAAVGAVLFTILVRLHAECAALLAFERSLLSLLRSEIELAQGSWRERPAGVQFQEAGHPYAGDLNFFGPKGIFAYLNRCPSPWAQEILAEWLKNPIIQSDEIRAQQAAHAELASKPDFLFSYLADLAISPISFEVRSKLRQWSALELSTLRNWQDFVLAYLMPAFTIGCVVGYLVDLITFSQFLFTLLVPAIPIFMRFRTHQNAFNALEGVRNSADRFGQMIDRIRKAQFENRQDAIFLQDANLAYAITQFKALGAIQAAVDSRNNLIVSSVLNILLQWDYHCYRRLAGWKNNFSDDFFQWVEFCEKMEASVSFGIYAFNHPDYTYASFDLNEGVSMRHGRHVLMDQSAVANDLEMIDETKMGIITGANMAGKSTFLRMVATHMVLSQIGLPVQAERMRMAPVRVFTSMLTTDSLADQESYFFNEIKRLRQLVDFAESGQPIFAVLDEILKGTNSVDKMKGSAAFVRKILTLPVRGLIATHDLSLCDLAEEYPKSVTNFRFEIDYTNGDLSFRYKLEPGICANMNATYLLEKYGLIDPPSAVASAD